MSSRPVTLADVARHAGVSASTVSYALSGKRPILDETRGRVERAVRELGYHPNTSARALAGKRSHMVALVVPLNTDVYVPTMTEIAISVTVTARQHGYNILLMTNDEGPEEVRRIAAGGLADGVILMDIRVGDERIPALRAQGIPTVLIGWPDDPAGLSCVDHDFPTMGALCADHLADLGHRDIAFVGYARAVYERHAGYAVRTLHGFRERAERRGLRFVHRPCEGTYESTAGTVARILADRPDTTGFVVQNEGAIGPLLDLLRASGRTVPEDASVIAICPESLAEQYTPRLTAVTGPKRELGQVAFEQIMARITAATEGAQPEDELRLLVPDLVIRESTAPAPGRGARP
ncbi:DNA-binding LacI/PurR family transcriptional regulator [Kitasatospora gansuensis]|uniref:DNA-binding LacI/PurR family transcriptional regulator n=1 Tax=Kitasatospora gansuensis TaxID=258050 RepID=A0A7W7WKN2_9ACTN|nr:LacI family DNA-binding transcriptional regulator [Kitasatospora gansuensis]MBB4951012.1 DNA-binding LacI/PurR family transcriptional regulator [Kitasatospora gansuensis]